MHWSVALVAASVLLAGCAGGKGDPAPGCDEGFEQNLHEDSCVKSVEPGAEVCHASLDGAADEEVSCQVQSADGAGWLEWTGSTTGTTTVRVSDGNGTQLFSGPLGGDAPGRLEGASGPWTLSVDFQGAAGKTRIVLWG